MSFVIAEKDFVFIEHHAFYSGRPDIKPETNAKSVHNISPVCLKASIHPANKIEKHIDAKLI
jgi:hypothetical protein